jgi:hypothetical protein
MALLALANFGKTQSSERIIATNLEVYVMVATANANKLDAKNSLSGSDSALLKALGKANKGKAPEERDTLETLAATVLAKPKEGPDGKPVMENGKAVMQPAKINTLRSQLSKIRSLFNKHGYDFSPFEPRDEGRGNRVEIDDFLSEISDVLPEGYEIPETDTNKQAA